MLAIQNQVWFPYLWLHEALTYNFAQIPILLFLFQLSKQ